MGGFWHPECFCCHACKLPITDYEFSMSGNGRYHKSCYKELHHPKCDVCKNFGHHHLPETRGLCLSEEQTVPTVEISWSVLVPFCRCSRNQFQENHNVSCNFQAIISSFDFRGLSQLYCP